MTAERLRTLLHEAQGIQRAVARRLGITPQRVGQLVAQHGLRGYALECRRAAGWRPVRAGHGPRAARCHPERRHAAKGYCAACYYEQVQRVRNAARRPYKPINVMGQVPGLGDPNVSLPAGPFPTRCGHCHAGLAALRWHPAAPEVACLLCGWETLVRPAGGFTAAHLARIPASA